MNHWEGSLQDPRADHQVPGAGFRGSRPLRASAGVRRPVYSSNQGFPGETSRVILLGFGVSCRAKSSREGYYAPHLVASHLTLYLAPRPFPSPHPAASPLSPPSLHTPPFSFTIFSFLISHGFFFCPFPPPSPLGRYHTGIADSPRDPRVPQSLFWRGRFPGGCGEVE